MMADQQQPKQKTAKAKNRHAANYKLLGRAEKNKIRRIARHVRNMRRRGHVDRFAEYCLGEAGGGKLLLQIRDRYV